MSEASELHWRDRLALRIMAWIAGALMTDALAGSRKEFEALRTSLSIGRFGT